MRTVLGRVLGHARGGKKVILADEWTFSALSAMLFSVGIGLLRGFLKSWRFKRRRGFTLLKRRAIIRFPGYLSVGKNFIAEEGCEINAIAKRGVVFGDRVTVGAYALIRPSNNYGGPIGEGLSVGDNSNIGPFAYIGCSGYIQIGNNVMMGPRVGLYAENHIFERTDIPMKQQGVSVETIIIEDDCWIGANSVILAGVRIGHGSIISAGSVVSKDVAPFTIVGGVPAKQIKSRIG